MNKLYDYIIVGAGASGLMTAYRMCSDTFFDDKNILLIDVEKKSKNDRTWCFWEDSEGEWDGILTTSWKKIAFKSEDFFKDDNIAPYQYKMIKSIDFYNTVWNLIDTKENDVIIIRKSTSDGSFDIGNETLDVELGGGNFAYTTASGIDAGDIVVDGDGFVTETTSKGPEEQVPGQVLDAVDIRVYNRQSDGQGIISTQNYITDGETLEYSFDYYPQSTTSIFVRLGAFVLDPDQLQIDWVGKTLAQADSTPFPAGRNLTITTIGTNGVSH
mgnify:CR=1 FL=1